MRDPTVMLCPMVRMYGTYFFFQVLMVAEQSCASVYQVG